MFATFKSSLGGFSARKQLSRPASPPGLHPGIDFSSARNQLPRPASPPGLHPGIDLLSARKTTLSRSFTPKTAPRHRFSIPLLRLRKPFHKTSSFPWSPPPVHSRPTQPQPFTHLIHSSYVTFLPVFSSSPNRVRFPPPRTRSYKTKKKPNDG